MRGDGGDLKWLEVMRGDMRRWGASGDGVVIDGWRCSENGVVMAW